MEHANVIYAIMIFYSFVTGWYLNSYGVLIPYYS